MGCYRKTHSPSDTMHLFGLCNWEALQRTAFISTLIMLAALCLGAEKSFAQYVLDWPEDAFKTGDRPELAQETLELLHSFGYAVGYDVPVKAETSEFLVRNAIKSVEARLGWKETGTISKQLVGALRQSRENNQFICPTIPSNSKTSMKYEDSAGSTPVHFYVKGRYPLRYAIQMLARLHQCTPDALPGVPNQAGFRKDPLDELFATRIRPPVTDPIALQSANDLVEGVSARSNATDGSQVLLPAKLYVLPQKTLITNVARASFQDRLLRRPITRPSDQELAAVCKAIGYKSGCAELIEGSSLAAAPGGTGQLHQYKYDAAIDHYEVTLSVDLPAGQAASLAEDMSQYLLEINPQLRHEAYRRPGIRIIDETGGNPLQGNTENDETCDEDCIKSKLERTHDLMQKKAGWPKTLKHGSTGAGNGSNRSDELRIVDGTLWHRGQYNKRLQSFRAVHAARNDDSMPMELQSGPVHSEFNVADLKHVYISPDREIGGGDLAMITRSPPKGDEKEDDPGHTLFAAGLVSGSFHQGNIRWGGAGHQTAPIPIVSSPVGYSQYLQSFPIDEYDGMKLGQVMQSHEQFTSVLVYDPPRICKTNKLTPPFDDIRDWLAHLLETFDKAAANHLTVVAAPYKCDPNVDQTKIQCNPKSTYAYQRSPTACFPSEAGSNHALIVAAANEKMNGLSPAHLTRNHGLAVERYLVAPGCGLVSADFDVVDGKGISGARLRSCGSSWAAPLVGALITNLRASRPSATNGDEDQKSLETGVDIKAYLLATSTPFANRQPRAAAYGLVNWTRAIHSNLGKVTVWFDGAEAKFPVNKAPLWEGHCDCFRGGTRTDLYDPGRGQCNQEGDLVRCEGSKLVIFDKGETFASDLKEMAKSFAFAGIRRYKAKDQHSFDGFAFSHYTDFARKNAGNAEARPILFFGSGEKDSTKLEIKWNKPVCSFSTFGPVSEPCLKLCKGSVDGDCLPINPTQFSHIIFGDALYKNRAADPSTATSQLLDAFSNMGG